MTFADSLSQYGHIWLMEGAVLTLLAVAMVMNWKKVVRFVTEHMISTALLLWIAGLALYMVGFSYEGTAGSFPALFFRSVQASLKMFLSENELIEVSPHYKESAVYMTVFATVHFLALFISAIFIFNTIGHRLKSSSAVFIESLRSHWNDRETYIFWGVNAPSVSLAGDIRRTQKDARIVFLHYAGKHSMGEKLELTQLIDSSAIRNRKSDLVALDSVPDAMLVYVPSENPDSARMASLRRIISHTTKVHFFFLTDDDELNVKLGRIVAGDVHFNFRPDQEVSVNVLSKENARRSVAEEQILLDGKHGNFSWTFVDHAMLAVSSLRNSPSKHPVATYPESSIDEGKVHGDYNAWLIGMGTTGSEMFRFLYEFSAFVGDDGKPVRRTFTLFDKQLQMKLGNLFRECPEVLASGCVKPVDQEVGTIGFWNMVKDNADSISSVSVAMGNDDLDVKIAREMYRHLLRYRTDMERKVKIYIRVYEPENQEVIDALAAEYRCDGIEIIPFGGVKDIFNTTIIMLKDLKDAFMAFNQRFDAIRGKNQGCSSQLCWERDFSISKYIRKHGDLTVALDEMRRRTQMCEAETFHIGTMVRLSGLGPGDDGKVLKLSDIVTTRDADSFAYAGADPGTQSLLDTLAMTAYLRQMYSHQLLGFTAASDGEVKADPAAAARKKLTQYVQPWDETDDKIRNVMYAIVDTSFAIAAEYVLYERRKLQ